MDLRGRPKTSETLFAKVIKGTNIIKNSKITCAFPRRLLLFVLYQSPLPHLERTQP